MTTKDKKTKAETPETSNRRRLLKGLAAGSAAITGQQVLPAKWSKPLVDAVIIPAHAQLSPPDAPDAKQPIEDPPSGDRLLEADDFPDTGQTADGDPANDTDFVTGVQDGADSGVDGDADTDRDGDQDEEAGDGTDVGDGSVGDTTDTF